jgi:transposase-like protein
MLSPHRDRLRPRVINVDGHPACRSAIAELKQAGELPEHSRYRRFPYRNNVIEQDHRFIKKRIVASQWFRSVEGALNTIQGYEANRSVD